MYEDGLGLGHMDRIGAVELGQQAGVRRVRDHTLQDRELVAAPPSLSYLDRHLVGLQRPSSRDESFTSPSPRAARAREGMRDGETGSQRSQRILRRP